MLICEIDCRCNIYIIIRYASTFESNIFLGKSI